MPMKIMKLALRFWIALTSVVSFLIGWAMLAHSPKPVQAKTVPAASSIAATPLPTLAPLPSFDFSGGSASNNIQIPPVSIQQPPAMVFQQQQAPILSTGGS